MKTPENEPFNLFVNYDRANQVETWYTQDPVHRGEVRFTMPMIELLDESTVMAVADDVAFASQVDLFPFVEPGEARTLVSPD